MNLIDVGNIILKIFHDCPWEKAGSYSIGIRTRNGIKLKCSRKRKEKAFSTRLWIRFWMMIADGIRVKINFNLFDDPQCECG